MQKEYNYSCSFAHTHTHTQRDGIDGVSINRADHLLSAIHRVEIYTRNVIFVNIP